MVDTRTRIFHRFLPGRADSWRDIPEVFAALPVFFRHVLILGFIRENSHLFCILQSVYNPENNWWRNIRTGRFLQKKQNYPDEHDGGGIIIRNNSFINSSGPVKGLSGRPARKKSCNISGGPA
jgi:hypothetical protein